MARLPDSVRKNAEQANNHLRGNTEGSEPAPATPKIDSPVLETPAPQTSNPEPQPPAEPAPNEPAPSDGDSPWEHKYSILQGKYNSEVPALHSEVRALKEQLANAGNSGEVERLRSEINQLRQQLATQSPAPTIPDVDKFREEYGSEMVDGVAAMVQGMIAPVQKQVETVNKTVTSTSVKASHDRMRSILKASNIDYDRVNNDPVFVDEYLQEVDPYSGLKRFDLVNDAFHSGEFERAALFFKSYVDSPAPNPGAKPDLGQHVQIPSSAPVGNEKVPTENVWTSESIKRFYHDKQNGKISPEEVKALETELFAFLAKQ